MDTWFAWAERLNQLSLSQFYSDQIWTNYTPGFLYFLAFLGFIKTFFHINANIFYLILKLPSIIAEMALGMFIYQIISKKSIIWARVASILVLFNPAFIFNSSIWGQIDGLFSLLLMLSIYFLNRQKLMPASMCLGLSFLIKPQAIAILPVFGLFLVKNPSMNKFFKLAIPALIAIFLLSLPFFITSPFLGLVQLFSKMSSDYPQTSLFAYNFWGAFGFWINDNTIWNGLSYQQHGYILLASYWMIISYLYFNRKLSLYAMATLSALGFFFLPTRVHERYLYPGIIFLAITIGFYKSRLLIILASLLSFIHFLNLYYVYVYYNELYFNLPKVLYHPLLYNFLDSNGKFLSAVSTVIFLLIIYVIKKLKA